MIEWGRLRMGVDIAPDTDYTEVPHCFTDEVPKYMLEIMNEEENWILFSDVEIDSLPETVESMHWDYDGPVRITENGYPVFTCWS